jgi:hypothetical protein
MGLTAGPVNMLPATHAFGDTGSACGTAQSGNPGTGGGRFGKAGCFGNCVFSEAMGLQAGGFAGACATPQVGCCLFARGKLGSGGEVVLAVKYLVVVLCYSYGVDATVERPCCTASQCAGDRRTLLPLYMQ